jgi:3',5'-cyclic AMP phosphodiesterase CpdA
MVGLTQRKPGLLAGPKFLWPSLGRPALLSEKDRAFTALIGIPAPGPDEASLRSGYALEAVNRPGLSIVPRVVRVTRTVDLPRDSPLRRAFRSSDRIAFYEVRLEAPPECGAAAAGRRFLLFDLVHPRLEPGRHSLAWIGHGWERFVFAFVADTHLAEEWDGLEADAGRLGASQDRLGGEIPDRMGRIFSRRAFEDNFINPNRRWREFVKEANARARRGDLDFVVLGGDLVDYQLPRNFGFFEDMVAGLVPGSVALETPLITVPGNHDYRRHPYRLQVYPLDRCGLHDLLRDHLFRRVRGKARARLGLADARAVLAGDGGRHPLAGYLVNIESKLDEVLTLGNAEVILIDTGRDAFRELFRVGPRRWGNFFRSVAYSWLFPSSVGLTDAQAGWLSRRVGKEGPASRIIVFHAGLTGGPPGRRRTGREAERSDVIARLPERKRPEDPLKTRVRLEKDLARAGQGGLFQNHLSILRAGASEGRAVLGLSGHFHRRILLRLDKSTGELSRDVVPPTELTSSSFERSAIFVGGAALGHGDPRSHPPGRPGFCRVEVAGNLIVSVRGETPSDPPPLFLRAESFDHENGQGGLSVSVEPREAWAPPGGAAVDITFMFFARPRNGVPGRFPYAAEAEQPGGVRPDEPRWIERAERLEFFGDPRPAYIQTFRCGPGPEWRFRFVPLKRPAGRTDVVVIAELFAGGGTGAPDKILWHPLSIRVRS